KALLPVHLYGHPADVDPLLEIARARGIPLVEDACQAHGARYKGRVVGALSGLGALSFYPTKNVGALGDGGAVLVNDPALAARLRRLRNGGQADRYHHAEPGINSRLDEMQAAVLRVGLRHLEPRNARRRELAELYRRGTAGRPAGGGEGGRGDRLAAPLPRDDRRAGPRRGGGGAGAGRAADVTPVAPGLAVLAGLVLFLFPGLTLLALLSPRDREETL